MTAPAKDAVDELIEAAHCVGLECGAATCNAGAWIAFMRRRDSIADAMREVDVAARAVADDADGNENFDADVLVQHELIRVLRTALARLDEVSR